jgi:hypothetical protein
LFVLEPERHRPGNRWMIQRRLTQRFEGPDKAVALLSRKRTGEGADHDRHARDRIDGVEYRTEPAGADRTLHLE